MITLKISAPLMIRIKADLSRPHSYAYERVGFLFCRSGYTKRQTLLLASDYQALPDDRYIADDSVGARFDSASIRSAMQHSLTHNLAVFHVHAHPHSGTPNFSRTDTREMANLMPCFVNLQPALPHGALILSDDSAVARYWVSGDSKSHSVDRILSVGKITKAAHD